MQLFVMLFMCFKENFFSKTALNQILQQTLAQMNSSVNNNKKARWFHMHMHLGSLMLYAHQLLLLNLLKSLNFSEFWHSILDYHVLFS